MADYIMNDEVFDWDDEIEEDEGGGYTLLPEGEYEFEVTDFKRGEFPGSSKLPACHKAMLTLRVKYEGKDVTLFEDLIMCKALEWKLSSFFRCIGKKKHGEKLRMCFPEAPGCKGRAAISLVEYEKKDGTKGKKNRVETWLEPDDTAAPTQGASKPEAKAGNWSL